MKRILATTAIALIMAGGTVVGSSFGAQIGMYQAQPTDMRVSQLIGQTIYATDTTPGDMVQVGAEKDWDNVGEINEVIVGRDGAVKAVVLGVGGFLGMGEKNVAVGLTDVKFVKNGEGPDDYFLVVNANKESLTSAPAFVTPEDKQAAADTATGNDGVVANGTATTADDTATAPAGTAADQAMTNDTANGTATTNDTAAAPAGTAADPAQQMDETANTTANSTDGTTTSSTANTMADRPMLTRPNVTRDGYAMARVEDLTAEKLQGASVYGPNDEDVGTINRIVLSSDGKQIERVVLDVGGFLGIGAREIAITMDELNIVQNADGSDMRVYVDSNEANLKAQPEYKG